MGEKLQKRSRAGSCSLSSMDFMKNEDLTVAKMVSDQDQQTV